MMCGDLCRLMRDRSAQMDESPGSRLQRESAAAWTASSNGPSFLRQTVPADSSSDAADSSGDAADSSSDAADTSSAISASLSPSPETKQSSAAGSSDTATSPGKSTSSENKQSDLTPSQQQQQQEEEQQPPQQAVPFGQVLPTQGDLASLPDCTRQLAAFPKLNRSDEAVRRFACIADTYLRPWMGSRLVKKGGGGGEEVEEEPRGIISHAMLQYVASEPGHSTVPRPLATIVTDPSFESAVASALVAELVDFAAACRLDYAASLVAESESVCPPSVGGECALGTDVLEDRQEDLECLAAAAPHLVSMLLAPEGDLDAPDIPTPCSYAEAIAGEYSSQWQTAMDAKMASWKSTGTYVDEVPFPEANIVSGMWIFRVKRPPGSPPVFKARYVARGFSQREGVDFFQTFSPTPKMTTLWVLLHVAAQRDYELHSLDFSTAFLQGSLHEEIWLRYPPGFTGSFPPGTQWSLRRPVYGLRQAPREWHDTLRTTLAALGFAPSTADPSLFLRTDTSLPPFYILVYVDDLVFATTDTEALALVKSEL
ncbi:unnamed protein product [Closterium sp. NIES-54]